jgi:cytochrome b
MNSTPSPAVTAPAPLPVRVWDLPTRVFHWLLLVLVVALVITGHEGGEGMVWHARCGYGVFTLLLFRLVWGVVGGHHSRFVHFLPSVSTFRAALGRVWRGPHLASVGHNPLGALSVLAFLLALGLQVASGLVSDDEIAFSGPLSALVPGHWVSLATWYHKAVGKRLIIALVVLHVLAIAYYRHRHGERLVSAMVLGDKQLHAAHAAQTPASLDGLRQRVHALVWLVVCGLVVRAVVQWGTGA